MVEKYVSLNGYSPAVWWRWSSSVIHASSGSATLRQVQMVMVIETTKYTTWCSQSKRLLESNRKCSLSLHIWSQQQLLIIGCSVVELVHAMSWPSHKSHHHLARFVIAPKITKASSRKIAKISLYYLWVGSKKASPVLPRDLTEAVSLYIC